MEASLATTFRTCSSSAPTSVKPQLAPAILSQESVHTTLTITHHTRKRHPPVLEPHMVLRLYFGRSCSVPLTQLRISSLDRCFLAWFPLCSGDCLDSSSCRGCCTCCICYLGGDCLRSSCCYLRACCFVCCLSSCCSCCLGVVCLGSCCCWRGRYFVC
jgi:hypothetical protein